jgi:hypothetical protein
MRKSVMSTIVVIATERLWVSSILSCKIKSVFYAIRVLLYSLIATKSELYHE